jgi:peptidoglycan hydrolase-like protein with peptidoglycan-binding domain
VVSDINNDGKKEIIVYTGGKPPKLFVYKQDGSLFWSADIGITEVAGGNLHIPLVGDINNDGFKEIIAYKMNIEGGVADWSGTLYAFNYDGSTLWTSKILTGNDVDFHPTMLMADLDLDGNKEIVVKGNNSAQEKIVIVSNEGSIISQWNLPNSSWGASIVSTPAIGNFDDDSELEIVSVSPTENAGYDREKKEWINEGAIYVYNMDGSVVTGWPVLVPGQPFSSPAVGDINNDGDLEIIVGLLYASDIFPDTRYGGLYAFDKSGNILPGWPFMKGYNFWSSPSLADFDGDGDLEIGASRLGFVTYILHHDGTIASGWPQSTCWNDYYSTIIGDVNSDGSLDILTTAGNGVGGSCYGKGGVYAWNFDGTSISGFPKLTEVDAQAPATIADIDNDGKVELIASSNDDYDYITKAYKHRGTIYVWELNQDYNRDKMKWPMFHHDPQHTGLYNATALTTKVVSVGGDLTLPYYTNTSTPIIVIFGETNMLCRWATSDLFYSQMSTTTPSQCGIEGSTSTCSLTDQGEDGQKTVYISCKDDFGNEQSIYQNLDVTFTLDTKKPEVSSAMAFPDPTKAGPVIITIQFNEEMATDTSPVVEIIGLKTLYTVIQSAYDSMTWTGKFELLDNDEERAATISVKGGKDLAGNVMDDNPTAGTFRVDTLAPQKPIVTDPSSPITVNADTYIIKGVAEASALVIIYKEKTSVGNQQLINGAINYSIEVNLAQDQANNFKVTATDAFGNESESTAVPTITEDSTPPTTPTINEVTTPTYSLTQLISGTKEAYTSVWLNQSKIIDLDEKTTWSYEISLSIGENPISITVKDSALNESGVATTSITRIGIGGGGGWVTPVSTIGEGNISESLGGEVRATFKSGQLAKVVFPSHSIKGTVVVKIEPRDKTEVVKTTPLPKNTQIVGELIADFKALSNGKELEKFEGVIPITFTYSDEQVKEAGIDEKTLKIYWWDKSTKTWKPLKSKVNILTNTVTAYTIHFTLFAIMGEIKAKPIEEMTIEELRAKITEILAKIAQLQAQLPQLLKQQITSEIPTSYRFTKPLRIRDKNIEVKYLQLFLKAQGSDIYPEGLVTGYFGYLTLNAVKRFQLKHGIITPKTSPKIAGYVGPQTRAKINEILGR